MKKIMLCALAIILSIPILNAQCGPGQNIDQNSVTAALTASSREQGNSFIAPCTGQIESLTIRINQVTVTGTATVTIHDGDTGVNVIGTTTLAIPAGGGDITATFATPVPVTAGSTYTYMVDPGTTLYRLAMGGGDPYPNGENLFNNGGVFQSSTSATLDFRFLIAFVDEVDPVAVCTNFTAQLDASGNVTINPSDVDGGSTDDSGSVTLSLDNDTFNCSNLGTNTVTLTATDAAGNTATCTATVTVEDTIAPTITCPSDITVSTDAGLCEANVTVPTPVAIDNCGNSGSSSLHFDGTDDQINVANGFGSALTETTVEARIFMETDSGFDVLLNYDGWNTGYLHFQMSNGSIGWSVNNNSPTDQVVDAGLVTGQWYTISVVYSSITNNVLYYVDGVLADTRTYTTADPIVGGIPFNIGSWGNSRFFDGNIDELRIWNTVRTPSEILNNYNATLSGSETGLVALYTFDGGTPCADNSGLTTLTDLAGGDNNGSIDNFDLSGGSGCDSNYDDPRIPSTLTLTNDFNGTSNASGVYPIGTTTVTWTVTDPGGNMTSCTMDVTVEDTEAPVITCPSDVTAATLPGECTATATYTAPTATDNCSGTTITQTGGLASGSLFPVGVTTNTFEVTDAAGNTTTCSFTVTVTDPDAPTITCSADITVGNDPGECSANLTVPMPSISDICGNDIIPDTFYVPYNFVGGELADTPAVLTGLTTATEDVFLDLTFSGDHNSTSEEFQLTGPDGTTIFSENDVDPTCVVTNRTITIPQATWNGWIGTFGTDLTFTLLEDTSVDFDQCTDGGNQNTFRLRVPQFGNLSLENDYTNTSDASAEYPVGTTLVTWTVTDVSGNSTSCVQTIIVNDTEAPVISNCPADITVDNDAGACTATVNFTMPTATDNCATYSDSLEEVLRNFNFTNNTITALIPTPFNFVLDEGLNADHIDDGGDDMYDDGNYISTDLSAGDINYSDNVVLNSTAFGTNGAYFTRKVENMWILAANLDGVNTFDITGELGADSDGTADGFTSTINVGGTNYSIFVKRVNEPSDPSVNHLIIIPENAAASHNFATDTDDDQHQVTGLAGTTRLYYLLFASENGGFIDNPTMEAIASSFITNATTPTGTLVQTTGLPSGSDFPVGTTTNTFVATDAAGNTTTCSFDVIVNDIEDPIAVCQDITVQLDASGSATITGADVDGGSTDNCGIASLTVSPNTFNCAQEGSTIPVTLTVTDVNGNVATCVANVTVDDQIPPTAVCQDITIQLDASGNASIVPADVDGGSTDNCGFTPLLSVTPNTFDCSNVGPNTVTLLVGDGNGNQSTCTAIVTVEDTMAPAAVCQNIDVILDANGTASITAADIDNGSNDNCGIASLSIDVTDFTCADIGSNDVTLTATDVNGNVSTCIAVVTVIDDMAPVISCPTDIVTNTDAGLCSAIVNFADAIASDNCNVTVSQTAGLPSGSDFPVGVSTVEFTATDDGGNTTSCSFTITVEDNEAPVAVCQDITIQLDANGDATITAADVDGGSNDACGVDTLAIDIDTFDCSNVGDNIVTLTVTDVNGNVSTCTATVTVEDATAPEVFCQDIIVDLDDAGTVTILPTDIDNGSTDACGIATYELDIDTFDCSHVGDNTVTLTVTDVNGNSATCTATVTVHDVTDPVLTCMDITVELDENGEATITPDDVIASSDDACGILTTAVDIFEFNCDDIGTPVTVQVFAEDNNGNLATCFATVTIVDTLAPELTCPADQTVDPGPGNLFYEIPDYFATGEATAIDNCTDPITLTTQDPVAGTLVPDGVYTITLTAEDEYGNLATCEFELTVDSVLGVGDNTIDLSTVVLYPNPATQVVYLSNPQGIALEEAAIYDLTGRLVKTIDLKDMGTERALDISQLATATYAIIITGENGQVVRQLIKE